MSHAIPLETQAQINAGVTWLWEQYAQKIVEKVAKRGVDEAKWQFGISKYYLSLFERVGFVRVLGRMESEPLDNSKLGSLRYHINIVHMFLFLWQKD